MPFSFIVAEKECPQCFHPTNKQDAVHFESKGVWTTASANPPYGNVTEDEVNDYDPDENITDLILESDDVVVTCGKCGQSLTFLRINRGDND